VSPRVALRHLELADKSLSAALNHASQARNTHIALAFEEVAKAVGHLRNIVQALVNEADG